jgi:hypothetical protein
MISLKSINYQLNINFDLTNDLLFLISNDLFVLVPHKFLLFFKVLNNLTERLFKNLDLSLKCLDLLLLSLAPLIILVNCTQLQHVCSFSLLVFFLKSQFLSLAVI